MNSGTTLHVWSLTTSIVVVPRLVRLADGADQEADADQRGDRHRRGDMNPEKDEDEAKADGQRRRASSRDA
ncbi:MAG: hypothetical protein M5R42_10650 [Rhodocyclaceae bacterium]|nr:hypothetical protein [Rhodocyclaceae bacterium]